MESRSQPAADAGEQAVGLEEKPVDFSQKLEDIIKEYGSACSLLEEKISILEKDEENLGEETRVTDQAANTGGSRSPETGPTACTTPEELGKEHVDLSYLI